MDWREELAKWPMYHPQFQIEPEGVALLIVDMQNWGVRPDLDMGQIIARKHASIAEYFYPRVTDTVIPNLRRLLEVVRGHSLPVIYLTVGPEREDGRDLADIIKRRLHSRTSTGGPAALPARGNWQHNVVEELRPRENELVVNKTSFGAFNSTGLDTVLQNLGVKSLIIGGVATDVCVETTARDAADRGYKCVVVDDACAAMDETSHNAALLAFAKSFGVVKSTDEVLTLLG